MGMGQGVRTGLGQGGIICVLQTQFSSFLFGCFIYVSSYYLVCCNSGFKFDKLIYIIRHC